MTNSLYALQRRFQATILDADPAHIEGSVARGRPVPPQLGIEVYTAGYRGRLGDVLAADFPKLQFVLGEDAFTRMTSAFIRDNPSGYRSIADIGAPLEAWLAQQTLYQAQPYLAELARLEWALCTAFVAANASALTAEDLGLVPASSWPSLRFSLPPSVQILHFEWDIPTAWHAIESGTFTQFKRHPALHVVCWREALNTHFDILTQADSVGLAAIVQGMDFGEVCEQLAAIVPAKEASLEAALMIKRWLGMGLLCGCE